MQNAAVRINLFHMILPPQTSSLASCDSLCFTNAMYGYWPEIASEPAIILDSGCKFGIRLPLIAPTNDDKSITKGNISVVQAANERLSRL